eukprot:4787823-Amphidinium_carterae.4
MSKPVLDKLVRHEGLTFAKDEPSKTLEDVLRKLLHHCLPKSSAEKYDEIIALRCKPKRVENIVASCSELLIEGNEDFVDEAASEDEHQELQSTVRRGKQLRANKQTKPVNARHWVAKKSLPEVASELHKAKELLPSVAGCRLTVDQKRFQRWSGTYPREHPPFYVTKAWGAGTGLSTAQALKYVLEVVWSWHAEATGERCPYDFES